MLSLMMLAVSLQAQPIHSCVGDFIFRAKHEEGSVGIRVRRDPAVVEILFSDYGNVSSTDIRWEENSVTVVDPTDKSNLVIVCDPQGATLVLPKSEYSPARSIILKRTVGSLWEIGTKEGWLKGE